MSKYTIGIDYGTLSVRTVLMNCSDGSVAAVSTMALPLEEIGYQAAGKLIRMIADPEKEGKEKTDIRIKSTLIERRSVARIG